MKRSTWLLSFILPVAFLLLCNNINAQLASTDANSKKASELVPTSMNKQALATYNEAVSLYDVGNTIKAREQFSKAIEMDPDFGMAYLMRANTASTLKDYTADINAGRSKVANGSEWEKIYADLQYTNLTSDYNKGLELAKKLATSYPYAARAQYELGNAYANGNQFAKAREAYNKAVELNPGWVGGFQGLTNSYLFHDPKDLKKAEVNAVKAAELQPTNSSSQVLLGDVYRAQNDLKKAREAYARSIELDPSEPTGYYKLGHANTYLGNFEDARKNYMDAAPHDVRQTFAKSMVAYTYLYEGSPDKAIAELIQNADWVKNSSTDENAKVPDELNFLTDAANIAFHTGDANTLNQVVPRIKDLTTTMGSQVGTAEGIANAKANALHFEILQAITDGKLDVAATKSEQMKQALNSIKDGRKLENYHFDMGMIDLKKQKYDDAIDHLKKSNPLDIYNKYELAKAYEAKGDKAKADWYYKEVAAYNFNNLGNALVRKEVREKLRM